MVTVNVQPTSGERWDKSLRRTFQGESQRAARRQRCGIIYWYSHACIPDLEAVKNSNKSIDQGHMYEMLDPPSSGDCPAHYEHSRLHTPKAGQTPATKPSH